MTCHEIMNLAGFELIIYLLGEYPHFHELLGRQLRVNNFWTASKVLPKQR